MPIFGNLISEIKERLKTLEPVKENKEVQVDYNDIVHELYIDNDGRTYTKHNLTDGLMLFTNFCNTTTDSNYDDWDPSQVGNPGPWWDAVCKMGKWYEQNIHTYQGTRGSEPLKGKNWYDCPLIKTKVADDCSGFVQACLRLHGVDCPSISTSIMNQDQFMTMMKMLDLYTYHILKKIEDQVILCVEDQEVIPKYLQLMKEVVDHFLGVIYMMGKPVVRVPNQLVCHVTHIIWVMYIYGEKHKNLDR